MGSVSCRFYEHTDLYPGLRDVSQVFVQCGPVPSYELSPIKPPKANMQTLQLTIAVSRSDQQLKFLPEESGVKQVKTVKGGVSYIALRAAISAQTEFLFFSFFFFPLQNIFSSCRFCCCLICFVLLFCGGFFVYIRPVLLVPVRKLGIT